MKRNGVPDLLVLLIFTGTCSILARQEFDYGLVEWVVANGGYFNPKQEIRREIPEDDTSRFGIFATKRIEEGETLSLIPWNVTIQGDEDDYRYGYGGHMIMCDTASRVAEEIMLDQKSKYAPYISHLQAQSTSQLPTSWSHTGKSLLEDVLGDPPAVVHSQAEEMLEFDWSKACNGYGIYNNDLLANATMLVHQLAEDGFMIPISDLYTHRNGYWHNARLEETDGAYKFTALRIIEVGEPIHDSIYKCDDCENDYSIFYGTPGKFTISPLELELFWLSNFFSFRDRTLL